jgi:hypothetical protein
VTICLAPDFAHRVSEALGGEKEKDYDEKIPGIIKRARDAIKKWRKPGPEQAAVMAVIIMDGDGDRELYPASAAYQGVELPPVMKSPFRAYDPVVVAEWAAAFKAAPLDYMRVLADSFLMDRCTEWKWEGDAEPVGDELDASRVAGDAVAMGLLREILGGPLGLLEETEAGLAELRARVRAQGWSEAAWRGAGGGKEGSSE